MDITSASQVTDLDTNTVKDIFYQNERKQNMQSSQHTDSSEASEEPENTERNKQKDGLMFGVDETPPFHLALMFSFQIILVNLSGSVTATFVLHRVLCGGSDYAFMAQLMSSVIFMSGLSTLLQVAFGVRIPVIQGSAFTYFPPVIAFMATDTWKCSNSMASIVLNQTLNGTENATGDHGTDMQEPWRPRLLIVSGSLMLAVAVEVFLGLTGIIGILMNFIGPLTLSPILMLISISLFPIAVRSAQEHWGIAFLTVILLLLFSVILGNIEVPVLNWNREKKCHVEKHKLFRMFASVLAIGISWIVCYILTKANHLPNSHDHVGYLARTDSKLDAITRSKWFVIPYPGQFGLPAISIGLFVGFLAAAISSVVESVGDYHATARICRLKNIPKHALNRGIAMEGFASVLSALVGTCHGTSSYSSVIGFISYTGVASRTLWILMSVIMMAFGIFGKLAGALASMPDPIVGGLFIVGLGLFFTVGINQLAKADLMLTRNQVTVGVAVAIGFMVQKYMEDNQNVIQTSNKELDVALQIVLSNSPLVGGLTAFILDNIFPGSREARGMGGRQTQSFTEELEKESKLFDLPFCTDQLRGFKIFSYVPFLPCYKVRTCPRSHCLSWTKKHSRNIAISGKEQLKNGTKVLEDEGQVSNDAMSKITYI